METIALSYEDAETPFEIASWINEMIGNEIARGFIAESAISVTMTQDIGHYPDSRHLYSAVVIFRVRPKS